jgi:hypothetical protein
VAVATVVAAAAARPVDRAGALEALEVKRFLTASIVRTDGKK